MLTINPQYVTNSNGEKVSAIIPITEFEAILEELEELEDIKLYDEAKISNEQSIPVSQAFEMIENKRKFQ